MRELVLSRLSRAAGRRCTSGCCGTGGTPSTAAIRVHSGGLHPNTLSTLPLNIKAAGIAITWYTLAISLNGLIVIAFELLVTKVTQSWPMKLSIALTVGLLGVGVALYGLPFGPAVILSGTLVWSLGEIIGGPATFAYPAVAAPARLKSHYIGSFQFMFGLGTAVGPAVGGWLFIRLGHGVWPVLALGSVLATVLVLVSVRQPPTPEVSGHPVAARGSGTARGARDAGRARCGGGARPALAARRSRPARWCRPVRWCRPARRFRRGRTT